MKQSFLLKWVGLALLGFALAACSSVEEVPITTQSANGDVSFFPGSLELSAPIGGSADGFFIIFNNGDEALAYTANVFFTEADVEITFGERGTLEPGGFAFVTFRATCVEGRLERDANGFFIASDISVATNDGTRFFPFINALPLTLRCL